MQITVNGEPHQLPTPLSLREALRQLGLELPTHAALALNERVIPSPPSADSPEAPLSP